MNTWPARRPREPHLACAVARPDARDEAVRRAVRQRDGFVLVDETHRGEHGAEHFLLREPVRRRHVAQQRGRLVEAAFGRVGDDLPVRGHRNAVVLRVGQEIPHALLLLRVDQRAAVEVGAARADAQPVERGGEPLDERLVHRALDQHAAAGRTGLPAVLHDRGHEHGRRRFEIGVGEHDLRRLAAEFERDGYVVLGRHLRDQLAGGRRSRERDVVDAGMACERGAGFMAVAGDDVQRTGWQPGSTASSATRSNDRHASSAGLTTQALPAASAAPTLRPKICIG